MNRYYKIPVSELKEIDPDWETRRQDVEGTEAIIHVETYERLISAIAGDIIPLSEEHSERKNYPIYQGKDLEELLNSPEWIPDQEGGRR